MTRDARVDAKIMAAAPFAQPLLTALRERAHAVCPGAEEDIKWGMPALLYHGKILCGFAGFKQHVAFYVPGDRQVEKQTSGMGDFGKMCELSDLPTKSEIAKHLKARMKVIDEGGSAKPTKPSKPADTPAVPADFLKALRASKAAHATFNAFAPSHKREYIEWIVEAKREDTRSRRIEQAVQQLIDAKSRHWKYQTKPKARPS